MFPFGGAASFIINPLHIWVAAIACIIGIRLIAYIDVEPA